MTYGSGKLIHDNNSVELSFSQKIAEAAVLGHRVSRETSSAIPRRHMFNPYHQAYWRQAGPSLNGPISQRIRGF